MVGREISMEEENGGGGSGSVESRPGVLLIGSPNVGKRTLLSRLLSVDIPDTDDLAGGVLCQGWTIETKYYSADISIWISHLVEDFSLRTLPISEQLAALVMVFDMNDESSLLALKSWAARIELEKFEILLCIGNKVDLVPGHNSHTNYRRFLQRRGESSSDPHPEFWDYGIDETEGFSLLGDEEPSSEIRSSCLEWCVQYNIEFIEACASNPDFDKCLSVDGDIQGVSRLFGALSAHMWPGMVMKSGERVTPHLPVEKEDITDDESDFEIEYEVLSGPPDDPWEFVSSTSKEAGIGDEQVTIRNNQDLDHEIAVGDKNVDLSTSKASIGASSHSNDISSETILSQTCGGDTVAEQLTSEVEAREVGGNTADSVESDEDAHYGHEDLERLMCEIGSMRDSLRLMPDFQRRDMAAKLAVKMASMFGYSSDEDGILE
ncbi:uncharacterized protein M6B38_135705 [Iris pallida]|uniref:Uncharacterized protein n=1 Tax=Iris pallida TaxID=29817 RepID=A0AAX6F584_IRIPA|nr:uncharacterized protein M6B38_153430 [Iris pallida]KAJ6815195.1 uncharacterized protein M6B38_135705 [Iris pallida]